jgi:hypothetical protein
MPAERSGFGVTKVRERRFSFSGERVQGVRYYRVSLAL